MREITMCVDGSFLSGSKKTHGGVVEWNTSYQDSPNRIHLESSVPDLVSMRNVGGEILAAYFAIYSAYIQSKNEEIKLNLIYDYKGVGAWGSGVWRANKPGTQWYVREVRKMLSSPNLCINWIWIKGHGSHAGNGLADAVASYDNKTNAKVCCVETLPCI